jgi:hypothetical protein
MADIIPFSDPAERAVIAFDVYRKSRLAERNDPKLVNSQQHQQRVRNAFRRFEDRFADIGANDSSEPNTAA